MGLENRFGFKKTYGYEQLFTLANLERVGLLCKRKKKEFLSILKSLRLNVENVNEIEPNDIAYVFSRYFGFISCQHNTNQLNERENKPINF